MATKYSVTKEIFSKRLKQLMNDNNETTYSIGEILNLSAATISRYADGKMAPKITTIYSMANHFNVNPVWLMGYDVEKILQNQNENTNLSKDEEKLIATYNKLNDIGKKEAYKRIQELSQIPLYMHEVAFDIAAHNDDLTEDENSIALQRALKAIIEDE